MLIILGGAFGNALDLFEFPIWAGGAWFLAETLKTLPVMNRRIHLAVALVYFSRGMGN